MKKKKNGKKSGKGAGRISFGGFFLLYAVLFGFRHLWDIVLGGAIAYGISRVIKAMATPMEGLHTNKDGKRKEPEPELRVDTPEDQRAKEVIAEGLELLSQIRKERDEIDEYVMTRRLTEIESLGMKMLQTVADDPDKAGRLRKYINYYLPTTLKLLQSYRTMKARGVSYQEMSATREDTIHAMDMILQASQKQLDAMYKDDLLDMSTDIDVLEQMLKRDGYMESAFADAARQAVQNETAQKAAAQQPARTQTVHPVQPAQTAPKQTRQTASQPQATQSAKTERAPFEHKIETPVLKVPENRTAAAEQLSHGAPTLEVPEEEQTFDSFYHQQSKSNSK